jgi:hypothetical protein
MSTYGENQKQIKQNVLALLEAFEQARNSDKYLLLKYWQVVDSIPMGEGFVQAFVGHSTSAESITRARRSIQSSGLFPPTDPDVLKKRKLLQEEARLHHSEQ